MGVALGSDSNALRVGPSGRFIERVYAWCGGSHRVEGSMVWRVACLAEEKYDSKLRGADLLIAATILCLRWGGVVRWGGMGWDEAERSGMSLRVESACRRLKPE